MMTGSLFTPFQVKTLKLKNRFVMAPMTRSFSPNGIPNSEVADYYQRRARGDVGLIISEGTVINRPSSSNRLDIPHFYGQESLDGWQKVIDGVHETGGVMAPQIWHMGIGSPLKPTDWKPEQPFEGPSGLFPRSGIWASVLPSNLPIGLPSNHSKAHRGCSQSAGSTALP